MISRVKRSRYKLKKVASPDRLRFSVFKSLKHVSAQIFEKDGSVKLAVSTSSKKCPVYNDCKTKKASWVGEEIVKRMKDDNENIPKVYFDRGKYAYHGVVKALAESARKSGLEF